jgi:glycosyltransferase involved in cell wall biosynthesis
MIGIFMSNIKVSVIVPGFNISKTIKRTLNSIINQTFENFELIFVNDGSTDDTLKIVENILLNSSISYKIINQSHSGVSSARNNGIKNANGKYLLFIDGDDYIDENHVKYLYDAIIKESSDFSFTNMANLSENEMESILLDEILLEKFNNEYNLLKNKSKISYSELIQLELLMKIPFSFCQLMYDSEILKKYNMHFNEGEIYGEDTEFALKACIHCKYIALTNKVTYFYIKSDQSSTSSISLNRFNFVNILEKIADYYSVHDNSDDFQRLIYNYRIPKSIFGNIMYLFFKNYELDSLLDELANLDLYSKLSHFKPFDKKDFFLLVKIKFFLLNPKLYFLFWKKFKNSI